MCLRLEALTSCSCEDFSVELDKIGGDNVKEENHHGLSEKRRRVSSAINQVAIGALILLWGSLLMLKQIGVIEASVSTLPIVLTAFGALLIFGGIYKYRTR